MRIASFLALVATLTLAGAASARAQSRSVGRGVVFVQTNEPAGNKIDVFDRGLDGRLSLAGSYATGGAGGVAVGAVTDPLASQSSLTLTGDGHTLIAVNAGSDTVTSFRVHDDHLQLRSIAPSGGQFPNSVAVRDDLVYVANAGGTGSVRGFRLEGSRLVAIPGSDRPLGLANSNPPNFLTAVGQIGYSPDGSKLFVTTKAATMAIDVFAVEADGTLSATPVSNPAANPVPFAFTFVSGRFVDVEAGTSSLTTYAISQDGSLTDPKSASDGQLALCWIAQVGEVFYGSNTASNNLSSFTIDSSGQPSLLQAVAATTDPGPTDLTVSGGYLYVESGPTGSVGEYAVNGDGTLTPIGAVTGLPAGIEGIAAT
jgi:6-phosphogluconolactonase (cycloisomerase 2 family)